MIFQKRIWYLLKVGRWIALLLSCVVMQIQWKRTTLGAGSQKTEANLYAALGPWYFAYDRLEISLIHLHLEPKRIPKNQEKNSVRRYRKSMSSWTCTSLLNIKLSNCTCFLTIVSHDLLVSGQYIEMTSGLVDHAMMSTFFWKAKLTEFLLWMCALLRI